MKEFTIWIKTKEFPKSSFVNMPLDWEYLGCTGKSTNKETLAVDSPVIGSEFWQSQNVNNGMLDQ